MDARIRTHYLVIFQSPTPGNRSGGKDPGAAGCLVNGCIGDVGPAPGRGIGRLSQHPIAIIDVYGRRHVGIIFVDFVADNARDRGPLGNPCPGIDPMIAVFDNKRGVGRDSVSSLNDAAILNADEPLFRPVDHRMTPIYCGCRSLNRIDGCILVADHRAVGYS